MTVWLYLLFLHFVVNFYFEISVEVEVEYSLEVGHQRVYPSLDN